MIIKKFYEYTDINNFIEYYNCSDCDVIYPVVQQGLSICKNCGGNNVKILTEDEYYSELENRIDDPEELSNILKNREEMKIGHIDPNALTHPNIHSNPTIRFDRINNINNG